MSEQWHEIAFRQKNEIESLSAQLTETQRLLDEANAKVEENLKAHWRISQRQQKEISNLTAQLESEREKVKRLVEPSESMIKAGGEMFYATLHSSADAKHHAYYVYMAMVGALLTELGEG